MIQPNIKDAFFLEKGCAYLNQGGFGTCPKEVVETRCNILREIEHAPDMYYASSFQKGRQIWRDVAHQTAQRFGAEGKDVAIVQNATDGVNAVLRSLTFKPGDEILVTSYVYGALHMAAKRIVEPQGCKVTLIPLSFPHPCPEECVAALDRAITQNTKLALLDHVTSATALVLPIKEMVQLCRKRGVLSLVDGAQAPGNVSLNLQDIGADWYVGNMHKWYFAPRGCGFLWAAPDKQKGLVSTILSWEVEKPFPDSFEWTGTNDQSPWMSVPAAYAFMDHFGEAKVREHNHALIREGLKIVEDAWGFKNETPDSMIGSAVIVPLPESTPYPLTDKGREACQNDLWLKHRVMTSVPLIAQNRMWLRFMAQIYNERRDYERLASVVLSLKNG
ncbi:MAG: aminotransferase class V-fold PLP-dependent enzyme [Proteobacteria bacterium]|jgi:isopenicillin-N epimerase|nr:aminotransferase class V-fold PLP-dependent enzyme [Alphaproteobacteria bacterium]NCC03174.1 aminotransferase class V-fold PLP-dependent enzyme [Pseudomonadota bacterium]